MRLVYISVNFFFFVYVITKLKACDLTLIGSLSIENKTVKNV